MLLLAIRTTRRPPVNVKGPKLFWCHSRPEQALDLCTEFGIWRREIPSRNTMQDAHAPRVERACARLGQDLKQSVQVHCVKGISFDCTVEVRNVKGITGELNLAGPVAVAP